MTPRQPLLPLLGTFQGAMIAGTLLLQGTTCFQAFSGESGLASGLQVLSLTEAVMVALSRRGSVRVVAGLRLYCCVRGWGYVISGFTTS